MAKFSGDYYMGFCDGKPHIFTINDVSPDNYEEVISVGQTRSEVAKHYEDVRKVRIMEIK